MKSSAAQNRLVIKLACECLTVNGFTSVSRNKHQGTFPDTHVTALDTRSGVEYLIGITGRVETKDDGDWDPKFNLVRTEDDRRQARELANTTNRTLAFVAIALRRLDNSYAAYFSELEPIGFPRSIPMHPRDRPCYRRLVDYTSDPRVKILLTS